ncbi:MAG: type II toxin-antitoxin system RelE/ParE family toxin [Saprospiraceae bacterium]|nr:type II toxin-antitoxin system RelE/ParE family toxin [Saprospiraceae bacterium]
MSKKIIWSDIAKQDIISIKKYFNARNKSNVYSKKLLVLFRDTVKLICKYPYLSVNTDRKKVRSFVVKSYIIFFEIKPDCIYIISVWDSRRDPDQLKRILEK